MQGLCNSAREVKTLVQKLSLKVEMEERHCKNLKDWISIVVSPDSKSAHKLPTSKESARNHIDNYVFSFGPRLGADKRKPHSDRRIPCNHNEYSVSHPQEGDDHYLQIKKDPAKMPLCRFSMINPVSL